MERDSIKTNGVHMLHKVTSVTDFEEKELKKLTQLKNNWVIWEHWQGMARKSVKGQSEEDYRCDLKKVGEFDNLVTFWQLWHRIPHANPASLFTVFEESDCKFYKAQ